MTANGPSISLPSGTEEMPTRKRRKKEPKESAGANSQELRTRAFAWDGVSFQVPENWNLAIHKYPKRITRLEFEDDFSVRIEAEWTRPRKLLDIDRIQRRYDVAARKFTENADHTRPLKNLPEGWVATFYRLGEDQRLVTAMFMAPESALFAFFMFHFEPEDPEDPETVTRSVAGTFEVQQGPRRKWELYDLSLETPADFKLINTQFQTGLKLLVFFWKRRKFQIWFANLATLILKQQPRGEWMSRILNSSRLFRSGVFWPDPADEARARFRRRRRHRLGHIDEIVRQCFEYKVECLHDAERNMLIPWVFSYRKDEDLAQLEHVYANGKQLFNIDNL